jgi:hypothetical protein
VYATDFAPTPEPDPADAFIANLKDRTRLRFISFLPATTAAVVIVVYLLALIAVVLAQLRP